ncbi:MAG: Fe-S-containing hydro-lyase [Candidatus Aureabacteria bacterium]|nr:Fe-S-containing hydro-lyase [Candidatus Auribacterota bacterium]
MASIEITTPLTDAIVKKLRTGDNVLITGTIYTARDAAHKRLVEAVDKGEKPPIEMKGQIFYYAGPSPAPPGKPIGSVGPTTSYRMDAFAPKTMELGLKGMIGKGPRSEEVIEAMKKHGAVYFAAVGGAGALLAKCVKAAKPVAYSDLGAEAITELTVEKFPAIVATDSRGNDLYQRK